MDKNHPEDPISYLYHELSPTEMAEAKRHFASCPECLSELKRAKETVQAYRELPRPKPPAGLARRAAAAALEAAANAGTSPAPAPTAAPGPMEGVAATPEFPAAASAAPSPAFHPAAGTNEIAATQVVPIAAPTAPQPPRARNAPEPEWPEAAMRRSWRTWFFHPAWTVAASVIFVCAVLIHFSPRRGWPTALPVQDSGEVRPLRQAQETVSSRDRDTATPKQATDQLPETSTPEPLPAPSMPVAAGGTMAAPKESAAPAPTATAPSQPQVEQVVAERMAEAAAAIKDASPATESAAEPHPEQSSAGPERFMAGSMATSPADREEESVAADARQTESAVPAAPASEPAMLDSAPPAAAAPTEDSAPGIDETARFAPAPPAAPAPISAWTETLKKKAEAAKPSSPAAPAFVPPASGDMPVSSAGAALDAKVEADMSGGAVGAKAARPAASMHKRQLPAAAPVPPAMAAPAAPALSRMRMEDARAKISADAAQAPFAPPMAEPLLSDDALYRSRPPSGRDDDHGVELVMPEGFAPPRIVMTPTPITDAEIKANLLFLLGLQLGQSAFDEARTTVSLLRRFDNAKANEMAALLEKMEMLAEQRDGKADASEAAAARQPDAAASSLAPESTADPEGHHPAEEGSGAAASVSQEPPTEEPAAIDAFPAEPEPMRPKALEPPLSGGTDSLETTAPAPGAIPAELPAADGDGVAAPPVATESIPAEESASPSLPVVNLPDPPVVYQGEEYVPPAAPAPQEPAAPEYQFSPWPEPRPAAPVVREEPRAPAAGTETPPTLWEQWKPEREPRRRGIFTTDPYERKR